MSSFQLKLVAIITMIIDHIGQFFFPQIVWLRIIGRISFPLFAFLIANGAHRSKNIYKYLGRIILFALISQIPFHFANKLLGLNYLNVLFTFSLSLLAIVSIRQFKNIFVKFLAVTVCIISASFLKIDYADFGVLLVLNYYLSFGNLRRIIAIQVILSILSSLVPAFNWQNGIVLSEIDLSPLLSLSSIPIISLYNHKEGPKTKYLFYIFFPLQYVVFYILKLILK